MLGELGNFLLAMGVGFASVQIFASLWGIYTNKLQYLNLGRGAAYFQAGFLGTAFLVLIVAFLICDFSLILVSLHNHTQLPWYYRLAATWGNHEGSLLLFVLILSATGMAQAALLKNSLFRARTLVCQGLLILLFVLFLILYSNPFAALSLLMTEGQSLNPLLQDRGLLTHPPLLYIGYVGFSAPFSMAIAALVGNEDGQVWAQLTRQWTLFAWGFLTAGITMGSWWAYYELGWGGWWFWDSVENASLMPWLAGTALLHTLRATHLYRWSLFLSLLTFGLSLLGTFLVRSGLLTSIHSFAQDPERGLIILFLLGLIMGIAFLIWMWKVPRTSADNLALLSRQGALLINSLLLCLGLLTVILGTFYPLLCDFFWGKTIAIGAPYYERTIIPLMVPLFILLPFGCLYKQRKDICLSILIPPLTALLGIFTLILYVFYPLSLWAFMGILMGSWIILGTGMAYTKRKISLGATLAHIGLGLSLLGVSVAGGLRSDEQGILGIGNFLNVAGIDLILEEIQEGKKSTYLYEKAILSFGGNRKIIPEKRLYHPQNTLLSKTAIHTNGLRDLYVILGPYQGNNEWLIRASFIPLAPWIWIGGAFMIWGAIISFFEQRRIRLTFLTHILDSRYPARTVKAMIVLFLLPTSLYADSALEKKARALYQEVRCPVCSGQSIADSEADEAQELKTFILDRLTKGESEDIIRESLRLQRGDEILFRPPFEGPTFFLWLAPYGLFFILFFGFLSKFLKQ